MKRNKVGIDADAKSTRKFLRITSEPSKYTIHYKDGTNPTVGKRKGFYIGYANKTSGTNSAYAAVQKNRIGDSRRRSKK